MRVVFFGRRVSSWATNERRSGPGGAAVYLASNDRLFLATSGRRFLAYSDVLLATPTERRLFWGYICVLANAPPASLTASLTSVRMYVCPLQALG